MLNREGMEKGEELGPCYICNGAVSSEYSVVFTWWDESRVIHPACIHTFAVGEVGRHFSGQEELFPQTLMESDYPLPSDAS